MLDLGLKISVEAKNVTMPFYFDRVNECVNCGGVNSLVFVDKFGHETKEEIRAFDHIKCVKCGRKYSIMWKNDPSNPQKMYPVATDNTLVQDFMNIVNMNDIKARGEKKLT